MSSSRPLVSAVLVTWNSERWLGASLASLAAQTLRDIEIIAVDNASADASAERVSHAAQHLIRNETNRGFSAAVNQAIALARGEFVLLLNPDCRLAPDYAERLIASLRVAGGDFGAATGMLVRASGETIEASGEIDSLGIRMTRSGRHLDLGQGAAVAEWPRLLDGLNRIGEAYEVFGVSGAAAMYRLSFLRAAAIGGEALDEDFFAWREDADLAWRGRLFGWRALCDPRAVAWHVRRVTPAVRRSLPAEINMHSVKNRFLLRAKNEGPLLALRNAPFELARDLLVLAATLTIERGSLPAFTWLAQNRARILRKRREVQRRRTISDRALARWFK